MKINGKFLLGKRSAYFYALFDKIKYNYEFRFNYIKTTANIINILLLLV